jgi:hypothetical protein
MVRLVGVEPTRPVGQQILSLPRMPLRISERMNFQFRAAAFNALNKVNLGAPNRYVNTPQFGTITMAMTPGREMQLSARLSSNIPGKTGHCEGWDALSAGRGHVILNCCPGVAELADALDSKSSGT